MRLTLVHYPNLIALLGNGWTESELCRIHNIHSKRFEVDLPETEGSIGNFTAMKLKRHVEDLHGIAVEDQVVRFRGRVLDDKETLVSCGIMSGSTLLLGLRRQPQAGPASPDDPEKMSTRTAERTASLTETMAEAAPQGDSAASSQPWWSESSISGPKGRPVTKPTEGGYASATPPVAQESASAPFTGSGNTLGSSEAPTSTDNSSSSTSMSAEELRRRRLERFK
eukprot:TRINITY_DN20406_c4_g1_i1.p1 TRINITY_DN20406_c4_g1~~TRINITY_DN20406_c4_g1_i1.p1  ORF type:complete len:225 (+),score=39.34 TRINITY_DN20406_c4_g1_i1:63-737(+)